MQVTDSTCICFMFRGGSVVIKTLKRMASHLPPSYQQEMKRLHFSRQIRRGTFRSNEPEYSRLEQWVGLGDHVLDLGANVGHYTARLSEIVGQSGRVFAFEPVARTFELLSANVAKLRLHNVTLLNVAASDSIAVLGMNMPRFDTGLTNYYMAQISTDNPRLSVFALPVDALLLPAPVKLAKIDVEGHELSALMGMATILKRDHPTLIVEGLSDTVAAYLVSFGYSYEQLRGSPNRVYR